MKAIAFISLFLCSSVLLFSQIEVSLYDYIPNSKPADNLESRSTDDNGILRIKDVSVPTLAIYKPQKPNGTAIIICPGGGYAIEAASHEGSDVAKALNGWGITAFVLKYRLPSARIMVDRSIGPLQDAERAIQFVRESADMWGINKNKIGIMGFSAGGHLAASLSTHYAEQLIENKKHISFRPDFSVLIYPVISFTDSLTHMGSRNNLLGSDTTTENIIKFSNEMQVNEHTPPAFLVHAKDDKAVPINNSLRYKEALEKYKIPVVLKVYETGGHGFGMIDKKEVDGNWMPYLKEWLQNSGFL